MGESVSDQQGVVYIALTIKWRLRAGDGYVEPHLSAANTYKYTASAGPGAEATDRVSRSDYNGWAPRWKGAIGLTWSPSAEIVGSFKGRYIGDYFDNYSGAGTGHLGDVWYVDASMNFEVGKLLQWDRPELSFTLGAVNLLDKLPEYSTYFFGWDIKQYDLRGRFVYGQFDILW